jgi:hypothetical protein
VFQYGTADSGKENMGMAYRNVAYAVVGLLAAGVLGFGCASIIGADEYKVAGGSPTTGGGGSASTTMTTTTSTGTAGTAGGGGSDGNLCSGPTPAGQAMCGPGKTCNLDICGPPPTFTCFTAGTGAEGATCKTDAQCAPGLACLHYNKLYACRKLCVMNTDCPAGYLCSESFTCGDNPDGAGKYCAKPCSDVVTAAGSAVCATGFRCNFGCDRMTHASLPPTCDFEAGTAKSGPCTTDSECAPGYYCLLSGTDGGATCTQACRSNADCVAGTCTGTIDCGDTATTYHYCESP